MRRRRGGFTLIEMLIVVTAIGIIMGIAIPTLINSIQRAKQKRSMGDMRTIATAAETYAIDYDIYPPSAASSVPVTIGGLGYPTSTIGANLSNYIQPTYLRVVPLTDGWNSWFLFSSDKSNYAIVCTGKDGAASQPTQSGPTSNFNTDIVFSNGQFTVYPEGMQQ
jgi:general secretion pathway protein G